MKLSPLLWCGLLLAAVASAANYSSILPRIDSLVREEMQEWGIGGVAIALVDDQEVVYATGFGQAKRDSVFRVGSISKLFNAVAVMQLVEAGRLDLDDPLPAEVSAINPFPGEPKITLRHLLSHRSGLPREGSVGGYMDESEPGLGPTALSVSSSVLVTKPGEKTRYSNLAPSIAGFLVEGASRESFEEYQQKHLFKPLGMTNSAWTLKRAPRKRLIPSRIRVADERGQLRSMECPVFDLGTIPAGNLFSSVDDLARFASALMAEGRGILTAGSLQQMWKPQFTTADTGFGLGFVIGNFRGHRSISHSGAVYGHSTSLVVLPEKKIAVIVLGNEDIVNGRIRCISNFALNQMLAAKFGEAAPETPQNFSHENLTALTGDYESQSYWAKLEVRDGKLVGNISGQLTKFTALSNLTFAAVSRLEDATPVVFIRGTSNAITGFTMGAQRFERVSSAPKPLPAEWRAVLGSYGPKLIPVIITERHGHLYAMTENMVDYRLTPVNRNACLLPPGMYVDEQVVFLTDKRGRVHGMNFANMNFSRN